MTELGGLRADAVEMGLISLLFAEERQVGGCWRSSRGAQTLRNIMAIVEFVYSKEEARGGQTHELKYKVETVGSKLNYETLRDAEGTFLRWFQANHPNQAVIRWKAVTNEDGIVSEYRANLAYGTAKSA